MYAKTTLSFLQQIVYPYFDVIILSLNKHIIRHNYDIK